MLKCIVCGKVIANVDPDHTNYGGCGECELQKVEKAMARRTKMIKGE